MRNIDRYQEDLNRLLSQGNELYFSLLNIVSPEQCMHELFLYYRKDEKEAEIYIDSAADFFNQYQPWYSESLVLLKQILPDRVNDFRSHYEKPKNRKIITFESYRIEDALQGVVRGETSIDSALPHLRQQISMLNAATKRFTSSLFDIQKLVQADLFDNELEAAKSLHKHKFYRAAGALAGVVLERHLKEVCQEREITLKIKNPTISALNDALKEKEIIDIPTWRKISYLADIRNKCDHSKEEDPTKDEISELINGVNQIIKTVY